MNMCHASFHWEWAPMTIKKNAAFKFSTAVEEDGMTRHNAYVMEKNHMGLPSTNNQVEKMWLAQDNLKKRMMEEENSQPAGKQSIICSLIQHISKI